MLKLVFNDKEYSIKFGYEATVRSGLVNKVVNQDEEDLESVLMLLPEMLLVGLQKFHDDEFGFDFDNEEEKTKQMSKVLAMLDDYFDREESDFGELYASLNEEMANNGFLFKMIQTLMKQAENQKKASKKK